MAQASSAVSDMLDPQKIRFVDVDGVRTRYYEDGDGEPLVLFHGGHFGEWYSLDCWSLNLADLAKHFHVYNMPGGLGSRPDTKARIRDDNAWVRVRVWK